MPASGEGSRLGAARRWDRAAFLLLIGAMALRVIVVLATRNDIVFQVPYLDAAFYHFWALSLATHAGDFVDAYFLGPLYPHVLSWVYRLGTPDLLVVRFLQTFLGCLNLVLVLQLGRRLHTASSGFFAALLLAFHGTLFFYEGILVMESLMATLILGASVLLLLPGTSRISRIACIVGAGLLLGAATAGRGTVLLLLPVCLWMLWKPLRMQAAEPAGNRATTMAWSTPRPRQAMFAVLLLLSWCLPLVPVLLHNAARDKPWTLTTNAGVNFYAGNHEGCRGRFRPPPGVEFFQSPVDLQQDPGRGAAGLAGIDLPPALAQRDLTTKSVAATPHAADSAAWFRHSWTWIRSHPVDFGVLLVRKTALMMQGSEIGQIESPAFHRRRLPVLRIFWVGWSLVLSLAVFGLWSGLRHPAHRAATQRLAILILTLLVPCVVFFVTARYRLVAVPLLCVLAGMGATALLLEWRQRRRRFWIFLVLFVGVFALTRIGGQTSRTMRAWENAQMAERLYATGQLDEALVFLQVADDLQPGRLEIQLNLALYWSERGAPGDVEAAEHLLRTLVGRFPDRPVLVFNWASLLEQTGKTAAARGAYRRVLELDPSFVAARRNLDALEGR